MLSSVYPTVVFGSGKSAMMSSNTDDYNEEDIAVLSPMRPGRSMRGVWAAQVNDDTRLILACQEGKSALTAIMMMMMVMMMMSILI